MKMIPIKEELFKKLRKTLPSPSLATEGDLHSATAPPTQSGSHHPFGCL